MSTQDENLALVRKWEETYNTDVERMVYECYAEDCEVSAMDLVTIRGHAKFVPVELQILQAAPRRYMKIVNAHPSGDVVTVQAVLYDPDRGAEWHTSFCAVLTIKNGRIVRDQTYLDRTRWPGLDK